jgi:type II secretory ATPase GspE/PulE/Tfp pilus assembly ATPase PilB-like protein
VKLAFKASRLKISLIDLPQDGEMELRLTGAATFFKVPALTQVLVDGACGHHGACAAE